MMSVKNITGNFIIILRSEVSWNLHIKLKHNGGNKTEREKMAVFYFYFKERNLLN